MNRLADFVVNHRIKVGIITLLMAFTVFAGIPNLRLDTDGRVFMANDNPDKILLDKFEQEFAKDDNLAIVIVPKNGESLHHGHLVRLANLLKICGTYPTFGLSIRSQVSKTPTQTEIRWW